MFGSAQEFLDAERPDVPNCLVRDVRLPGMNELALQREIANRKIHIPIIFIMAHGDIPMSVRAMKAGAVEFLTKLFRMLPIKRRLFENESNGLRTRCP